MYVNFVVTKKYGVFAIFVLMDRMSQYKKTFQIKKYIHIAIIILHLKLYRYMYEKFTAGGGGKRVLR